MSQHQPQSDPLETIAAAEPALEKPLARLKAELVFARRLAESRPERAAEWEPLIARAAAHVAEGIGSGRTGVEALVSEAEAIMAPLGEVAKEYTIYCCGHAHIDMNWMWTWPETVSVTYDTFVTMDRLMDEFPDFHLSQSQVSVYHAMQRYAPEVFERIKQRVAEGRWEVTASQWVEGDKNLAGGEILCRHLLYARRWLQSEMGLPFNAVKIDWECDTFGHCWTLPGILQRGGVRRYYHHRNSPERFRKVAAREASQLFWWQGKDGSRVLAYDDSPDAYNCEITPQMVDRLFDFERHTGFKGRLWVYGVGDHGGGPTRRHLRAAIEMRDWPIWPTVKLTTTDDFYTALERHIAEHGDCLPVHDGELNCVFEGCYTAESRIKFANRTGENRLVEAECAALAAWKLCGAEYPAADINQAWRNAMFIQFHDILPGSGVRETVEHAMGLFQETLALTGSITTRSLRSLAARVDTSALATRPSPSATDLGLGGGAGNGAWWGDVSTLGAGACGGDPFVIFNPAPFARNEVLSVRIWDRPLRTGQVVVRDAAGSCVAGQVTGRAQYWGHEYVDVAFPVRALPQLGYRAYTVEPGTVGSANGGAYARETGRPIYSLGYVSAQMLEPVAVGNDLIEAVISPQAGGIISLVHKQTAREFVPAGRVLGVLDREQEAPHSMTAWQLGTIVSSVNPLAGSVLSVTQSGPHVATVELRGRHGESEYRLTVSVACDSPQIRFELDVNWLERGDAQSGVPVLRASFPLAIAGGRATFEIPCGSIERPADGEEVPALMWADLTGQAPDGATVGATLLNDSKYGHRASSDALRLTLLRSSYDPDPLPELGRHTIRYALVPHVGPLDVAEAARRGYAFNHPPIPVGTTAHEGALPPDGGLLEILTPNVMLSGLKKAEDSDAVILRLYEITGEQTRAQVRLSHALVAPDSPAMETDLMEQPLPESSAAMEGDVLSVTVPAYGIATVKVGG